MQRLIVTYGYDGPGAAYGFVVLSLGGARLFCSYTNHYFYMVTSVLFYILSIRK